MPHCARFSRNRKSIFTDPRTPAAPWAGPGMRIRPCRDAVALLLVWVGLIASQTLAQGADKESSWLVVPGVRVGPIVAGTTLADLIKIYGPASVQEASIDVGEGDLHPGAVVYSGDPSRKAEIVWKDANRKRLPERIIVTGYHMSKSLWRTSEGITIGTTVKQLERLNGRSFLLLGFDWDYTGTVTSWRNGKLQKPLGQKLTLRLDHSTPDPSKIVGQAYRSVVGDQEVRSDFWVMQTLNPRVYQMVISF